MKRYALAFVAALLALSTGSHKSQPAPGSYTPCGLLVGTTAVNIIFPAPGYTGPPNPTTYLSIENTSGNNVWFNAWGGPATQSTPSWLLPPGFGYYFNEADPAVPQAVSVIASGPSSGVTCFYR